MEFGICKMNMSMPVCVYAYLYACNMYVRHVCIFIYVCMMCVCVCGCLYACMHVSCVYLPPCLSVSMCPWRLVRVIGTTSPRCPELALPRPKHYTSNSKVSSFAGQGSPLPGVHRHPESPVVDGTETRSCLGTDFRFLYVGFPKGGQDVRSPRNHVDIWFETRLGWQEFGAYSSVYPT